MLFIKEKKKEGVKVNINLPQEDVDIAINSYSDYINLKEEIRHWLKENRAKEYKVIEEKYENSEWKF